MAKPTDAALAAALRPLADALITPESIRREKEHDSTHREDGQLRAEKVEGRLRNNRTGVIDSASVQVPATSAGPAGSLKRHLDRIADTIRAGACDLLVDELGAVITDEFGDPILVGDCGDDAGAYALGRVTTHIASTSNPHGVTKAQVGLGSVDNTSDAAKPVSTAQQTALNLKANLASPTFTGTVGGITPAMIGLDPDTATLSLPASTTISAFGASLVDDANAAAAIATLGLDADIATLALPASTTISAFGASLVDDADAAAVLTTLGITPAVAELNYVDGVTSAIQTQLDAKQPLDSDLTTIAGLTATTDNVIQSVAGSWASRTMAQFKTALALALADIVAALGYTPVNKAGDTMTGVLTSVGPMIINTPSSTLTALRHNNDASGAGINIQKSRNVTPGAHTVLQSGDIIFGFNAQGSDGAAFLNAARIVMGVDGTPGTNDMPGYVFFATTPDGGATAIERLRVDSTGTTHVLGALSLVDGITAPATVAGKALLYVDSADGSLKVKFGSGTIKTLATDP